MSATAPSALGDEELLALLLTEGDRLPRSAVDEAVSRGERLVDGLAAILRERKNWDRVDAGWWSTVHATFILGAIGGAEAAAALLEAFDLSAEYDHDWLFEEWPSMLGRLGPGVIEELKRRVNEPAGNDFWVARALSGLAAVASRHPERRTDAFAFIRAVAADEEREPAIRLMAGDILLDFRSKEDETLLMDLAGHEENDHFDADEVRAELAKAEPALTWYQRDWLGFYDPAEIAGRQERWASERLTEEDAWYEGVNAAADELDRLPDISPNKAEKKLSDLGAALPTLRRMIDAEPGSLTKEEGLAQYGAALRLCDAVRQEPARWRLFEACLYDLDRWLMGLPLQLADRGLVDEAEGLGAAWADVRLPDIFLSDRALILAQAGRATPARAQAKQVLRLFGHDLWMAKKVGRAYLALGDWAEAEEVLRSTRRRAPPGGEHRHLTELLAGALRGSGKAGEADALLAEEEPWPVDEPEHYRGRVLYQGPIVRQGPKVGRNDPCPCGSGKKHKKCCLGKP